MRIVIAPVVLLFILLTLAAPGEAQAATLTYDVGECVDPNDYTFECFKWAGGKGFEVTSDMPEWTFGDRFRSDWTLYSEDWQSHMVFRRTDPFSLAALDLQLGGFADFADGCASPMEIRSSRGGFFRAEPNAGGPGAQCWQYTDAGFDIAPYPWSNTTRTLSFSGEEWSDLTWFYVGFEPAYLYGIPRPRFTTFQVHSVGYVPEPAVAWLFGAGIVALAARQLSRQRQH